MPLNSPKLKGMSGKLVDIVIDTKQVDFEISSGDDAAPWRFSFHPDGISATVTEEGGLLLVDDGGLKQAKTSHAIREEIARLEALLEKAQRKYQRDHINAQLYALKWVIGESGES